MTKKTIKIKLLGFWDGFNPDSHILINVLKKKYDVQFVDTNPEYIICSVFGKPYDYCKYPQIRIMFSGENYIPDFNLVDYAISSYPVNYSDRSFRLPQCFGTVKNSAWGLKDKNRDYNVDILKEKVYFANFIFSHESENNMRGDFFKKLSEYKRVESSGSFMNNMPEGKCVSRADGSKLDFQRKSKFTICFESTKHEGFITEKIVEAFYSDTIPIYYGSSDVSGIFNEEAFINCTGYDSFDEVIDRIIELDKHDEKYLEMLRKPIFTNPEYPGLLMNDFEAFVYNIFDQPVEKAYRRSLVYCAKQYNDYLIGVNKEENDNKTAVVNGGIFNAIKKSVMFWKR
ncbi:MAG: hypothetical protein J5590_03655 [Clostridia bacterium]|nr:hypothetical protein [Clostridia bacterium]